jgi:hypothetical protein
MKNFDIEDFLQSLIEPFKATNYSNIIFSNRFSIDERNTMIKYLNECGYCPSDWKQLDFYWNNRMQKSCNACWDYMKPDLVFLSSDFHYDYRMPGFKKLVCVASHELQHRWQFHTLGLLYFIFTIPIVRNLTIEVLANRVMYKVYKYFQIPESEWL